MGKIYQVLIDDQISFTMDHELSSRDINDVKVRYNTRFVGTLTTTKLNETTKQYRFSKIDSGKNPREV